jgi:paraquat-inducible protein A
MTQQPINGGDNTAASAGLVPCESCHLLTHWRPSDADSEQHCPRCGAPLHGRIPNSIGRCWALLIAAIALYFPANLLPIMTVKSLGSGSPNTIFSGIMELIAAKMWPVAMVVLIASIVVPLLKISTLSYLLISVQRGSVKRRRDRTRMYRLTEAIGRWSMVDIYVVAILVAAIQLGNIAEIEAGPAGIPFAGVVILTMLAAAAFDPRLIWDAGEPDRD